MLRCEHDNETLGLTVLDEPAGLQSDPTILDLQVGFWSDFFFLDLFSDRFYIFPIPVEVSEQEDESSWKPGEEGEGHGCSSKGFLAQINEASASILILYNLK